MMFGRNRRSERQFRIGNTGGEVWRRRNASGLRRFYGAICGRDKLTRQIAGQHIVRKPLMPLSLNVHVHEREGENPEHQPRDKQASREGGISLKRGWLFDTRGRCME